MQVSEQTGNDGTISVANRSGGKVLEIPLDTEFPLGRTNDKRNL